MSPRFFFLFFGIANSFALLSKNLQSNINENLMPRDLVKMKAVDPNWRGEGIFERITKVAGLFVHRETNKIILETKEKLWTESEIIDKLAYVGSEYQYAYRFYKFKNLIQTKRWEKLFVRCWEYNQFAELRFWHSDTDQFGKYWREALAEIVDLNTKYTGKKYWRDHRTLLMKATRGTEFNVVKILLKRCADVSTKDRDGWTALHYAACGNRIDVIDLLLQSGAEIDAIDDSEETPLIKAARLNSHSDAIKLLLQRGARCDMKNDYGITALHYSAVYDRIEAIKLLLEFGAKINAIDNSAETPLMNAARRNNVNAVKMLLEHDARLNMKNKHGKTALGIAIDNEEGRTNSAQSGNENEKIIQLLEMKRLSNHWNRNKTKFC